MTTRGKFQCASVKQNLYSASSRIFEFHAVSNDGTPENERFHKYTPQGSLVITVDNPAVQFELGKYYYLDLNLVET